MSIISNKLKLVIFLLLCSSLGFAQGAVYINGTQSVTGASTAASSINGAVDTFMLQYYTTGTPATLSIQIEGDNGSGSFVLCGAASTVTTAGQLKCVGNYKQIRYNLTTLTGGSSPTVTATLVGNSSADEPTGTAAAQVQGTTAAGSSPTGNGNPVLVAGKDVNSGNVQIVPLGQAGTVVAVANSGGGVDGLANTILFPGNGTNTNSGLEVAPIIFNGATWDRQISCINRAKLNALGAATTQIVALSGANKIRVCNATISNNNATATTLKFVEGTGANCGTGTADVSALMNIGATSTAPVFLNYGSTSPLVIATGGDALCLTSSAASSLEITIMYEQH